MKKKIIFVIGIIAILAISAFALETINKTKNEIIVPLNLTDNQMVIFKSEECGCCGNYASYIEEKIGKGNVQVNVMPNSVDINKKFDIPKDMQSCHTAFIGNYVVEGHVPIEAINKLLSEKPDIRGIALPGMPLGSPGMPGSKTGEFIIYSLNKDGSTQEFMKL